MLAACASEYGVSATDADAAADAAAASDSPAASPPDAAAGGDADAASGVDASDGAVSCVQVKENALIEADTFLQVGVTCDGSLSFGTITNLTISSTMLALVRFGWSPEAEAAAAAGRLSSLALVLDENPTCNGNCGAGAHVPGTFSVYPARTDWDEGNGAPYSGVDGCRRTSGTGAGGGSGKGWGLAVAAASAATAISPGVDYGTTSVADFTLPAGGTKLTFTVPGASALFSMRTAGKLAFLVVGKGSAFFLGATRESVTHPAPSLVVTYCK
jgi:hypothetical protein